MEISKLKAVIEAILFAAGRPVSIKELILNLELTRRRHRKHHSQYARRIQTTNKRN